MKQGSQRPKHALVTGGAGFIGSHLTDRLIDEGWEVTVVDNFDPFYDSAVKHQNIGAHVSNPRFRLVGPNFHSEYPGDAPQTWADGRNDSQFIGYRHVTNFSQGHNDLSHWAAPPEQCHGTIL